MRSAGDSHAHHDDEEAAHAEDGEAEHHDEAEIDEKTANELGIRTAKVGPGTVRDAHEVQGLLTPIEGKHARVRARYAGPVQSVRVGVGDVVKAGQTLATIESNVSLTAYAVTAPFGGTILDVAAVPGDLAGDQPLFELADLSSLWVDLHLFGGDAQHILRECPSRSSGSAMAHRPLPNLIEFFRALRLPVKAPLHAPRSRTRMVNGGRVPRYAHA